MINKEQNAQECDASKAEATTEAGKKTPLISKGGAEVEKLAEDILDKHFPHSWYTPVYPKKSKPIHDNECRRCKDDDSLLAAMIEMYNQAQTQKAGDGWKEALDEISDKFAFQIPYDGTKDFYDQKRLDAFRAGAEWAKQFIGKQ